MNKEAVYELANAIVRRAVTDYREALNHGDRFAAEECERFFRSGWFQLLTDVDGEQLIHKLKEETKS